MFCSKCGNEVVEGDFCNKCGNRLNNSGPQQQQVNQQQVNMDSSNPYQKVPKPHYAPGSFVEGLHGFGKSILFLIGIILFSAGNFFNIFVGFNVFSVFYLLYLALPITGFWLIYAASYSPTMPEKALPALTLFKAAIITDLVIKCLGAFGALIGAIFMFFLASQFGYGGGALIGGGFGLLLVAGGVVAYNVIYFKLTLNVINGTRLGITNNNFRSLPNIKVFTVLTYIGVGITVFYSLIMFASFSYIFGSVISYIPREFRSIVNGFLFAPNPFSIFFVLVANAGVVLYIIVLNQFKAFTETKTGA